MRTAPVHWPWSDPEEELPERQRSVLNVVREHLDTHGYPPSRPEIARALGVANVSTVDWHLTALMKKGWIDVRPDTQRGLRLLREGLPVFSIEAIATWNPVNVADHVEGRISREVAKAFSPRADYFLAVQDDVGRKWGVADNSLLAVATEVVPEDGKVVVARLGERLALKRVRWIDKGHVELLAYGANDECQPPVVVDVQSDELSIEGVVVGVLVGPASDAGVA